MNPSEFDPGVLEYARQRVITVLPGMEIASKLKTIPPQYQYSDEVTIGFEKFYSTSRKDLEPQKLDLSRDSTLLLIAQKKMTTESQVDWDNIISSTNRVGTRSNDLPLQSESAIREPQSIVSRSESGFNSTCLKSEPPQNTPQSVGLDSYFAPLVAQRLGFGTVWGPSKNYDTPPRLLKVLAQSQDFGSVKLDLSKKAHTLISKDWRPDSELSSKFVDSMRYEMLFQHKVSLLSARSILNRD